MVMNLLGSAGSVRLVGCDESGAEGEARPVELKLGAQGGELLGSWLPYMVSERAASSEWGPMGCAGRRLTGRCGLAAARSLAERPPQVHRPYQRRFPPHLSRPRYRLQLYCCRVRCGSRVPCCWCAAHAP